MSLPAWLTIRAQCVWTDLKVEMLTGNQHAAIRHAYYQQHKSIGKIACALGLHDSVSAAL